MFYTCTKADCRFIYAYSLPTTVFSQSLFVFSTEICQFYSGGGWTLVVSISSKNNDHLQGNSNNCLNSVLCVPAHESVITARKLGDADIHKLAMDEGRQITENEYSMSDEMVKVQLAIARSEVQMETGDEFLNLSITRKITLKLLSLSSGRFCRVINCNRVDGFQKSEKLETSYGFGGRHLRIYGIWVTFDRPQPGYYAMKHNQTW